MISALINAMKQNKSEIEFRNLDLIPTKRNNTKRSDMF